MTSAHQPGVPECKTRRGWLNRAASAAGYVGMFDRLAKTADTAVERARAAELRDEWKRLEQKYRAEAAKLSS